MIFKDGLLSTYKKAKMWNIPIVSILWIEACRTKHRLCDPKDYPISNIDRYENPELYAKIKVSKGKTFHKCNLFTHSIKSAVVHQPISLFFF